MVKLRTQGSDYAAVAKVRTVQDETPELEPLARTGRALERVVLGLLDTVDLQHSTREHPRLRKQFCRTGRKDTPTGEQTFHCVYY